MAHYGSEEGFEAYCVRLGYTVSPGEVPPALERGTAYLDGHYGASYPGVPTSDTQELGWPRTGAVNCRGYAIPSDVIPKEIENATYEATRRELTTPGGLTPDVVVGQIKQSVSVDGAVSVTYATGKGSTADIVAAQTPTITAIDNMLACLLAGGNSAGNSRVKWLSRA
jgi:hypothetical protein